MLTDEDKNSILDIIKTMKRNELLETINILKAIKRISELDEIVMRNSNGSSDLDTLLYDTEEFLSSCSRIIRSNNTMIDAVWRKL